MNNKTNKKLTNPVLYIVLVLITVLAFIARIYQAGTLPKILNRDEAALAYNAYLLKEVGTDEWGQPWPISLQSFGDYKLPGYVVVLATFFTLLGESDLVVRLPSVISGTLLVLVGFKFAQILLPQKPKREVKTFSLIFAFLIATSPVFFYFSRVAFEANLGLLLFISSLNFVFDTSSTNKGTLFSIILMLAAVLTYNTPLILLPFIVLILPFIKGLKKWRSWLLPVIGYTLIFIIVFSVLFPLARQKSGITIFSDALIWTESVSYRLQFSGIWRSILGNKYIFYAQVIVKNYLKSFSPGFLLKNIEGHPWHQIFGWGYIYWSILILGWLGMLVSTYRIFKSFPKKIKEARLSLVILYLLFISLIPAVITVDAPHPTRSLFFFWMYNLTAVIGLKFLTNLVVHFRKRLKMLIPFIFVGVVCLSSSNYLSDYFTFFPENHPIKLGVGYDQLIQQVETAYPDQEIAVIDSEGFQYILTAWYLRIDPQTYYQTVIMQNPDKVGLRYGERLTHYHFISQSDDRSEHEKIEIKFINDQWKVLKH